MLLCFVIFFYGLGTPYGSVHQICFAKVSYYENRFSKVECQNWSVATVVGPTSEIRAYTVFFFRASKNENV